jgi:quinol monooxygenase YgiN
MSEVILVVDIEIKEQFFDEVFEKIKELHKLTHKLDKGCLQYDLHTIKDSPNKLFLIERWQNQELLDEHMQKSHFVQFQEFADGKIESVSMRFLDKYIG